ncbi:MAG: hypothetical protein A49_14540 [Methyloceanibacter sp.]|nr:MAG: hypothetical protein A49_14540 [Methyloceanibacter sp.]
MPDRTTELRDAILAYRDFLRGGERRSQLEYTPFLESDGNTSYSPIGKTECILIRGCDTVEQIRPLRKRLRAAADAACRDKALGPAVEALSAAMASLSTAADSTVNQCNGLIDVNPKTGERRPFCEYVRASVLDALDRALRRLPASEAGDRRERGGESGRPTTLLEPIPVVSVVKVVGREAGRSDKLADKMKRRNYPVEKRAGKYFCQRADAMAMFPNRRERIKEI